MHHSAAHGVDDEVLNARLQTPVAELYRAQLVCAHQRLPVTHALLHLDAKSTDVAYSLPAHTYPIVGERPTTSSLRLVLLGIFLHAVMTGAKLIEHNVHVV